MMITNLEELHSCLSADALHYEKRTSGRLKRIRNSLCVDPISNQKNIWNYIKTLRYVEFYTNRHKTWEIPLLIYYRCKLNRLAYKTGFQIPPNVVGPGLTIWHWGTIIINERTRIGKNVVLNPLVVIGHKTPGGGCPIIGDDCFIGCGAKIFGDIRIGNHVTIAPNAVVVKNVPDGMTVGGIPAKSLK